MQILFLIIGLLIGAVLTGLLVQNKRKGLEAELLLARQQTDSEARQRRDTEARLAAAADQLAALQQQLTAAKVAASAVQAQLDTERRQHDEEEARRSERQARLEDERREQQLHRERQLQQQFEAQLETVREQFQNLAARVMDHTADRLKTQNTESMQTLTAPLRENISKLHEAIAQTNRRRRAPPPRWHSSSKPWPSRRRR